MARAPHRQRGLALLALIALVMVAAAGTYLAAFSITRVRLHHEEKTTLALAQARELVLAYAASAAAGRPGELIFPDRHNDAAGYDGKEDCATGTLHGGLLVGRLAHVTEAACIPVRPGFGVSLSDAGGETLWYAVSRHLMRPTHQAVLNSNTTGNWLLVRGPDGSVVASEVAVVLIAPGPALAGQNRAGNAAGPAHYLDALTNDGVTYSNADGDEVFVQAEPDDTFNDRLIWITRSELMGALTWRVAADLKVHLEDTAHHPVFPDAPPASIAQMPYWETNWQPVADYAKVDDDRATIRFDGCAAIYTLIRDDVLQRDLPEC